jgi:hypothetical protein
LRKVKFKKNSAFKKINNLHRQGSVVLISPWICYQREFGYLEGGRGGGGRRIWLFGIFWFKRRGKNMG